VGRDQEFGVLQHVLKGALGGRGVLVLVSGEAGIGKTSLVEVASRHAEAGGATMATGRCYEGSGAPAFAPWHDLFADLGAVSGLDAATLPRPFGSGTAAESAYGLMQTVAGQVAAAARQRPLILLLDDLHWADPDTLELLWFVSRDLRTTPLAVLATYRPEEVHRHHPLYATLPRLQRDRPVERIHLTPLSPVHAAQLVETAYGPCSPEFATYLHARSDGHPFFMVELLRHMAERRMLERNEAGQMTPPVEEIGVPSVLDQVITQRIVRLGNNAEALLEVAAIVGQEWDLDVVERVLGWPEDQVLAVVRAGLNARLIAADDSRMDRYRFAHALIREVLYSQPVARRRRQMHARIGTVLETLAGNDRGLTADPAALAYHFTAAETWEKAARYGLAAGDAARDRYATHSAAHQYEQARDAARRISSADGAQRAITLAGRLGQVYQVLNQQERAESAFVQMQEMARTAGDRRAEGEALAWLGLIRARLNRMVEARSTGEQAMQLADAVGDARLRALAYATVGHVLEVTGDLEAGARQAEIAETLARQAGHDDVLRQSLLDQAMMAVWRAEYARAERLADEARERARDAHDAQAYGGACWRLGLALGEVGRYDQAVHLVQRGLDHAHESGERRNLAKLLNTMGWLHAELHDALAAEQWDRRALEVSRQGNAVWVIEAERYSLLNLATDALLAGDVAAAQAWLEETEPLLDRSQYSRFRYLNRYQVLRAELALAQADHHLAARWAEEAHALAAAKGVRKNVARSQVLLGRTLLALGRPAAAVQQLRLAVETADAIGHGSLRWQARLWLSRAHTSTRRFDPADQSRAEGLEVVTVLADAIEDGRRRATFLASPLVQALQASAAAPRTSRPVRPAGLTAREVEILRLVAQGQTNATIAEALTISPRTVDVHLTSVFSKTGSANRAAATAFALRHGLA
jgi:DNA-binding CsgD family transcriptional regulator/tetratricopeptide (TPR) repeat protein